jgi:hypothetical protein
MAAVGGSQPVKVKIWRENIQPAGGVKSWLR